MGSQHKGQSVTILGCISFFICLCQTNLSGFIISASYQSSGNYSTHTGFLYRSGGLMNVHLHIIKAGSSAFHHFKNSKAGSPIGILIGHLLLDRVNGSEQPVHKGKVICHISHKRHIRMGMTVYESGNYQLVLTVNNFFLCKTFRRITDCRNSIPFDINTGFLYFIFFSVWKNR